MPTSRSRGVLSARECKHFLEHWAMAHYHPRRPYFLVILSGPGYFLANRTLREGGSGTAPSGKHRITVFASYLLIGNYQKFLRKIINERMAAVLDKEYRVKEMV